MENQTKNQCQCPLLCSNAVNARDNLGNFTLQSLPYDQKDLEPYISSQTISFHYGKHLATYIANTNKLKFATKFADFSIQEIILQSDGQLFNNASQIFNHYFQFEELCSPNKKKEPSLMLQKEIDKYFGNFDKFKDNFTTAATTLFGSGYAWLVQNKDNQLEVIQMKNAASPLKDNKRPLLNLDIWEHAYYLDTQNNRSKYIENFWNIINWDVVNQRFCPHCDCK